jgi:hypothetical protein
MSHAWGVEAVCRFSVYVRSYAYIHTSIIVLHMIDVSWQYQGGPGDAAGAGDDDDDDDVPELVEDFEQTSKAK